MRDVNSDPFFAAVCLVVAPEALPILEVLWAKGAFDGIDLCRIMSREQRAHRVIMRRYDALKQAIAASPYGPCLQFVETYYEAEDDEEPLDEREFEVIKLTILSVPPEFASRDPQSHEIR